MTTYIIYQNKAYTYQELSKKLKRIPNRLQKFILQDDESAVLMRFLEGHWVRVTPMECLKRVQLNGYIVKSKGKEFIYINC